MSFPTVKKAVDSLPGITAPLKSVKPPPARAREPEFVVCVLIAVSSISPYCTASAVTLLFQA